MKNIQYKVSINPYDDYLDRAEIEQFKLVCPACGDIVHLLEFSDHLKDDIDKIKT